VTSRVLVAEQIAPRGIDALKAAGLDVDERLGLDPDQLLEAVRDAAALIVRSATPVTAEVLAAGPASVSTTWTLPRRRAGA
jgi:D-3-phosphoglycerate dehydrogenase